MSSSISEGICKARFYSVGRDFMELDGFRLSDFFKMNMDRIIFIQFQSRSFFSGIHLCQSFHEVGRQEFIATFIIMLLKIIDAFSTIWAKGKFISAVVIATNDIA